MTAGHDEQHVKQAEELIRAAFGHVEDVTTQEQLRAIHELLEDDEPVEINTELTVLDVALSYGRHGLSVVPIIPGEKYPPMDEWQHFATTDEDVICRWFTGRYKGFGVGIAPRELADGRWLFVVDVDEHDEANNGVETWAELEETYGKLPETWTVLSPTGRGRHLYFSAPEEIRNGKTSRLGAGVDVRGNGGQVCAPPTIHPKGGQYVWEHEHSPDDIALAEAPDWLLALLHREPKPKKQSERPASDYGGDSPADRFNREVSWQTLLEADDWSFSHTDNDGVDYWTRPGKDKRDGASASVGYEGKDILHMFSSSVAFLKEGDNYSKFRYYSCRHFQGDMKAAARALASRYFEADVAEVDKWLDSIEAEQLDTVTLVDDVTVEPSVVHVDELATEPTTTTSHEPTRQEKETPTLPEEFWTARPVLEHIRQAARSRLVPPVAVLGHVLATVSAHTPPTFCVPSFVGGHTPLSLYVAQVASSGEGKSAPTKVVTESDGLLPMLGSPLALGSGEGLAETFLEEVEELHDGKKVRRKKQTRYGAVFHLDEGSALADIASRKGATILPTLRTAWTGGTLGAANASQDTRRLLNGGQYHLGVTFLFQPTKARPLFDDTDGGLPQRFLFIDSVALDAPDTEPDWPGALKWKPRELSAIDGVVQHHPLIYPPHVAEQIRQERRLKLRKQLVTSPLDAHRNLHRLKLAGVLRLLDDNERIHERPPVVDDLDWHLAGLLLDYSDAVRQTVLNVLEAEDKDKERTATRRAVSRSVALIEGEERRAFESAIRAVTSKLRKNGKPLSRRELWHSISSKHRQLVIVDNVLDEAVRRELVSKDGDLYTLGKRAT